MPQERLYIVTYDISDSKRLRHVFKAMKGYGHWLQLSVFQCRLTLRRRINMATCLEDIIQSSKDHILILDLGPADKVNLHVESLGKGYEMPTRQATII